MARFLVDENCDAAVTRALRDAGQDVVSIAETNPGSEDPPILARAVSERRIVVTEDKDFGTLVYAEGRANSGVILLRYRAPQKDAVITALVQLAMDPTIDSSGAFCVVEPGRIRISRLRPRIRPSRQSRAGFALRFSPGGVIIDCMTLLHAGPIQLPLEPNAEGVIRVAGTRVTLDTVIAAFKSGASAEQIVDQYASLGLGDVYVVIGYYLRNRELVEDYLAERTKVREAVRQEIAGRFDPNGIRDRLIARVAKNGH